MAKPTKDFYGKNVIPGYTGPTIRPGSGASVVSPPSAPSTPSSPSTTSSGGGSTSSSIKDSPNYKNASPSLQKAMEAQSAKTPNITVKVGPEGYKGLSPSQIQTAAKYNAGTSFSGTSGTSATSNMGGYKVTQTIGEQGTIATKAEALPTAINAAQVMAQFRSLSPNDRTPENLNALAVSASVKNAEAASLLSQETVKTASAGFNVLGAGPKISSQIPPLMEKQSPVPETTRVNFNAGDVPTGKYGVSFVPFGEIKVEGLMQLRRESRGEKSPVEDKIMGKSEYLEKIMKPYGEFSKVPSTKSTSTEISQPSMLDRREARGVYASKFSSIKTNIPETKINILEADKQIIINRMEKGNKPTDVNTWQNTLKLTNEIDVYNELAAKGLATPKQTEYILSQLPKNIQDNTAKIYLESQSKFMPSIPEKIINLPQGKIKLEFVTAPSEKILDLIKVSPTISPARSNIEENLRTEKMGYSKIQEVITGKALEEKSRAEKILETISPILIETNKMNEGLMTDNILFNKLEADKQKINDVLTVNYDKYMQNPTEENYKELIVPFYNEAKKIQAQQDIIYQKSMPIEQKIKENISILSAAKADIEKYNKNLFFYNDKLKQLDEKQTEKLKEFTPEATNILDALAKKGETSGSGWDAVIGLGAKAGKIAFDMPISEGIVSTARQYGKNVKEYLESGNLASPDILKAIPSTGLPLAFGQTSWTKGGETAPNPIIALGLDFGMMGDTTKYRRLDWENVWGKVALGGISSQLIKGYVAGMVPTAIKELPKGMMTSGIAKKIPWVVQAGKTALKTLPTGTVIGGLSSAPSIITELNKPIEERSSGSVLYNSLGNIAGFMALDLMGRGTYKVGEKIGQAQLTKDINVDLTNLLKNTIQRGTVKVGDEKTIGNIVQTSEGKQYFPKVDRTIQIKATGVTKNIAGEPTTPTSHISPKTGALGESLAPESMTKVGTESTTFFEYKIFQGKNGPLLKQGNLGYSEYGGEGYAKLLNNKDIELMKAGTLSFKPSKGKGWITLQQDQTLIKPKDLVNYKLIQATQKTSIGQKLKLSPKKLKESIKNQQILSREPAVGPITERGGKEFAFSDTFKKQIDEIVGASTGKGSTLVKSNIDIASFEKPVVSSGETILVKDSLGKYIQIPYGTTTETFVGKTSSGVAPFKIGVGKLKIDKFGNVVSKEPFNINMFIDKATEKVASGMEKTTNVVQKALSENKMFSSKSGTVAGGRANIGFNEDMAGRYNFRSAIGGTPSSKINVDIAKTPIITKTIPKKLSFQQLESISQYSPKTSIGQISVGKQIKSTLVSSSPDFGGFGMNMFKSAAELETPSRIYTATVMPELKIGTTPLFVSSPKVEISPITTSTVNTIPETTSLPKVSASSITIPEEITMPEQIVVPEVPTNISGYSFGGMPTIPYPTNWWLAGVRPASQIPQGYLPQKRRFLKSWIITNPIKTPAQFYGLGAEKQIQQARRQQKNERLLALTGLGKTNFKNRIKELV